MAKTRTWTPEELKALSGGFEGSTPPEVLRWALDTFPGDSIALACSFGAEDVALCHMASRIQPGVRVFSLDTGLLFPETYATRDRIAAAYPLRIERISPALSLSEQAGRHGDALWSRDPDRCCAIRKVEPLERVLRTLECWVTGIRRDQAPTRARAGIVEWDSRFGLVKVNPLARWTWDDVWGYIRGHEVPYNPLHDRGYPSIGCTHCTRPVAPGDDPRSGRWAGQGKIECGLHARAR